ncbi:hypothetical protein PHISCL_03381 [Aspergillus sclerotialis]|uniref:Uncharacterized protein n=1 Tax=Aspergillus sclerotialis TaxID=2070753 RepID=A0A3A2ZMA2_9EURO|nr:hypothetical protein PHISCL_03381 [Aspergillus sclerotialis]
MSLFIALFLGASAVVAVPQLRPSIATHFYIPVPTWVIDQAPGQGGAGSKLERASEDQQSETDGEFEMSEEQNNSLDIPTNSQSSMTETSDPIQSGPIVEPISTTPEDADGTEANELDFSTITPIAALVPTNSSHSAIISNTPSNITITTPSPTKPSKSLIPHWSYKKSSIAAAVIFSTIAFAAFIFLLVMYIRRLRRAWNKRKLERQKRITSSYSSIPLSEDNPTIDPKLVSEGKSEGKSDRESFMFSGSLTNSSAYVFDEDRGSMLTRPSCMNSSSAVTLDQMEGISQASSDRAKAVLAPVNLATLDRQYDPHLLSSQRRGSLAKSIVVVPSPLNPVAPLSARTSSVIYEQSALHNPHVASHAPLQQAVDARKSQESAGSWTSGDSNKLKLLPSIERSSSPIFRFPGV